MRPEIQMRNITLVAGCAVAALIAIEGRAGTWAQVRADNRWRAWVDGRLLVNRA